MLRRISVGSWRSGGRSIVGGFAQVQVGLV